MNHYSFRQATMEDVSQLLALGIQSYGKYEKVLDEDDWEDMKSFISNQQCYEELLLIATCFVALDEKKIIGMAFLIPQGNPTEIFSAKHCYLRMVGVHPTYAGNGIGRQLTERCIIHARKLGEKTMALHTSEFMDAARHLYEKIGFRQAKELPSLFGKQYWLYELDLALNESKTR